MKIISSFHWLLSSTARVYKELLFNAKLTLPKLSSFANGRRISNIPFTNTNRQCEVTKLCPEIKTPLQIKLPAENHVNRSRIYMGHYPSVTTILDATRPKSNLFALLNWRRKQIVDLGKIGYEEMVANIKNHGTTFHEAMKQYLATGSKPELLESNEGHWKSVSHILSNIDEVMALESVVVHPELHYAGTLDGLVSYQEQLCVIDWKTSAKKRTILKDCFSYPHQIVAYAGAVNYDQNYAPIGVCSGLLVLAYNDGSPADTIWMPQETCQYYWDEWLIRIELFNQLSKPAASDMYLTEKQGKKLSDLAHYVGDPVMTQSEDATAEHQPSELCALKEEMEHGGFGVRERSDGGD